jgi:hypothetical protein
MSETTERKKFWDSACVECGRVFNLLDEDEASEFFYGHDCEGE